MGWVRVEASQQVVGEMTLVGSTQDTRLHILQPSVSILATSTSALPVAVWQTPEGVLCYRRRVPT